jgi:hypothetical protein
LLLVSLAKRSGRMSIGPVSRAKHWISWLHEQLRENWLDFS